MSPISSGVSHGTVTVVIPTFNAVEETCAALQSVLAQTYPNWNAIVVDDGSTIDNQTLLLDHIKAMDPRIAVKFHDDNKGVASARNTALRHATGQYVAFLDCDDVWHPKKLARQIAFMKENRAGLSFTGYRNIDLSGREVSRLIPDDIVNYRRLLVGNTIGNSTVIIDRLIVEIPDIPDLRRRQDFALWLLIMKDGHSGYGLPVVLTDRRVSKSSLSADKFGATLDTWRMYRYGLGFGPFASATLAASHVLQAALRRHLFAKTEVQE